MKFIADTQAFLWFITDSPRLSSKAKKLFESPESERLLSVASRWEIAIKTNLGKLSFEQPLEQFLPEQIGRNYFQLLGISMAHVFRVARLPLHHRDPFDRMIIAQSLVEKLSVISSDGALDAYGVERFW